MYPTDVYPSTDLLRAGLEAIGYRHENLVLEGRYFSRYTAPSGATWLTSNSRITYPFASSTAKEISKDKRLAYSLAQSEGVTVPYTRTVLIEEDVSSIWDETVMHAPLVVKPGDATLSRGLTMDIHDYETLIDAISKARTFSETVLVQQQVQGQEIRFAVLDGVCKAAIIRKPAHIIGDGKSSIGELIRLENKERAELDLPYTTYPQLAEPLIDMSKFDMSRVLDGGEILELDQSAMVRHGASAYNVFQDVHSDYKKVAETLASALGQGFVAVDLLIKDYTQPLTPTNYAFLEFNMSPNLGVFYCCRDGRQYDILRELAPMIDRALNGQGVL